MSVKKQKQPGANLQQYLKIAEIKDDTVMLKDGSIRAVIKITPINFDLKSEQEQNGIIYSYQEFLNTLEFPIQILIKSKKLDIETYQEKLKDVYYNQENDLLKNLTANYIEYINRLVDIADIMQKEFYIVVPKDPINVKNTLNIFQKFARIISPADTAQDYKFRRGEFDTLKKGLDQRVQSITNGLNNMGLRAKKLDTIKLIELYYQSYNLDIATTQKPKNLNKIDIELEHIEDKKE